MTTDRKKLLEGRSKARRALAHADLPQEIRERYKRVADLADLVLRLQELPRKPPRIDGSGR